MHIIYREFVNKNPQINTIAELNEKFPSYLEYRLIELYPEDSYKGMVKDGIQELKALEDNYNQYISELKYYNYSIDDALFKVLDDSTEDENWPDEMAANMYYIPTLEQEIDSLQMTAEEIQLWMDIENFVNDTTGGLAKKADINRFILAKPNNWIQAGLIAAGVGGYMYLRAITCSNRAQSKERSYFDGKKTYDTRGDAFRHTFVSVLLRRYLTKFMSWLIMDGREWSAASNDYAGKEMDLHNNYLGRTKKYWYFRANVIWDRYDWVKWGKRVRNYIKNQDKRAYIEEWVTNKPGYVVPTKAAAKTRADRVSSWKFIYFNPNPKGNAGLEN